MEQLTTIEASVLETEDADRHPNLAIGTLVIIDGPIPLRERLTAALSERIRHVPRFTHVVHQHPFELAGLKSLAGGSHVAFTAVCSA